MKTFGAVRQVALFSGLVAAATPAFAQRTAGQASTAGQDAPAGLAPSTVAAPDTSAPVQNGIADIVVTAQRRSESLQKVPISITAFNAASLQSRNVTSTDDLMKATPGLQIGSGSIQRNELTIRGIGSNRFDAGGEASSGLFIDDVYQPRFSNLLVNLLDVERVEVLKGPQGTLYGRNTIGGAIAIYTPVPDQTFHLVGRVDVGNKDLYSGQGSVSGPLSDTLALGVSGGYYHRHGFMKDTVSGRTNGGENYGGRAKLAWTPTDRLKVVLTAGAFKTEQDALVYDRATNDVFFARPGIVNPTDNSRYEQAYNQRTGASTRVFQVSGRADYTGEDAVLTSITAYQRTKDLSVDDQDTSTADSFGYSFNSVSHVFSQEVRLSSTPSGGLSFGGRLKWLAGLYYFQEKGTERVNFRLGSDSLSVFLANIGNPAPVSQIFNLNGKTVSVKSYAAFGQATYALTDALNLTVGARYTRDKKAFDITGVTTFPGTPLITSNFDTPVARSWGKFTPKVAVDYTIVPDVLVYASYARGYKSGAPQAAVFNPVLAARLVDPETVGTVEIGVKTQFLDRRVRLNVAAYRSKFKDLQVRRFVAITPGGPVQPVLDNAASSTIKGVEVDATIIPVEHLSLDIGYNYLDARYGTFVPQPGVDYSGNRLPRAPKNTITGNVRYEIPLANGGKVALGSQTFYSSRIFFAPDDLPTQVQRPYSTTDLTLTYIFPNRRLQTSLWARNVFDKEYITYLEQQTPGWRQSWSDRRTIGATINYRI